MTMIIHHLVHELLVTDGARMRKLPVVSILAPLQGPVVAELFATLWADIPENKVLPEISIFPTLSPSGARRAGWLKKHSKMKREDWFFVVVKI